MATTARQRIISLSVSWTEEPDDSVTSALCALLLRLPALRAVELWGTLPPDQDTLGQCLLLDALTSLPQLEELSLLAQDAVSSVHLLADRLRRLTVNVCFDDLPDSFIASICRLHRLQELRIEIAHTSDTFAWRLLAHGLPPALEQLEMSMCPMLGFCTLRLALEAGRLVSLEVSRQPTGLRSLACFISKALDMGAGGFNRVGQAADLRPAGQAQLGHDSLAQLQLRRVRIPRLGLGPEDLAALQGPEMQRLRTVLGRCEDVEVGAVVLDKPSQHEGWSVGAGALMEVLSLLGGRVSELCLLLPGPYGIGIPLRRTTVTEAEVETRPNVDVPAPDGAPSEAVGGAPSMRALAAPAAATVAADAAAEGGESERGGARQASLVQLALEQIFGPRAGGGGGDGRGLGRALEWGSPTDGRYTKLYLLQLAGPGVDLMALSPTTLDEWLLNLAYQSGLSERLRSSDSEDEDGAEEEEGGGEEDGGGRGAGRSGRGGSKGRAAYLQVCWSLEAPFASAVLVQCSTGAALEELLDSAELARWQATRLGPEGLADAVMRLEALSLKVPCFTWGPRLMPKHGIHDVIDLFVYAMCKVAEAVWDGEGFSAGWSQQQRLSWLLKQGKLLYDMEPELEVL
ncbi:hypothetical protein GPECTOR_3g504 [Gonium pectorale]|uniref:Uncharacterized protein n=1 Tax=Gonium pectorale TaxID=33097 RepID=A0A150GZM8_GONPE|nr:hypothetical protein GPECTOR_3g504 [Gonium pectorale]|eukprot:KXZ55377.1 hypothetical protein GPECTOR_3g504 [Gonium pectorale]